MKNISEMDNPNQTMPNIFPGYLMVEMTCMVCRHHWWGIAPIGSHGANCPACDEELDVDWVPDEREEIKHDGTWLTGEWDLPYIGDDDEDDEPEFDLRLAPWWVRVMAFVAAVKGIFTELFGKG